ncbi:MAG TPA: hypothetical protein VGF73_02930 [Chthoniobacterales bacterium]
MIPVLDELAHRSSFSNLAPEIRHTANIFFIAGDDIVESDYASLAHKRRVVFKIQLHPVVTMIAIDKKKIEGRAAKQLLHSFNRSRSLRIGPQNTNLLATLA